MRRLIATVMSIGILLLSIGNSYAGAVVSSDRSREAASRVRNRMEKELLKRGFKWGDAVFIRVFKDESILELWMKNEAHGYELFKTFPVCRFSGGLGPKRKTGDRKTPEGFYSIRSGSFNPFSSYHLSLNIGFPNKYDRHHGRTGSYLMIHGDCVSIGCLAMTDVGIEEIYALVEAAIEAGETEVPLHIFPFRLDRFTLYRYLRFDSFGFWRELREGYRYFEDHRKPPRIEVLDGKYVVTHL